MSRPKRTSRPCWRKRANPDYRSCSTNSDCLSRDQLAGVFTALGKIIPDLHWTIKDIWTSGNRIVVRGEATGTPTGELFGVKPTGKSFKTISIDMFTVRDGKLATAYHVENWMADHGADQVERKCLFPELGNITISNSYAYIISCR